ncbi:MAG TPA: hypothetical protein PLH23_19325 [Hyphomonadaceae bacterium]|nr:hypothetical protein [Hyphomonadaceae bacterium]
MEIGSVAPLPAAPAGWFDYHSTVLADGRIALIRASVDLRSMERRWRDAILKGESQTRPPAPTGIAGRFSVFDGERETDTMETSLGSSPHVSRWPDGRWLVTAARARHHDKNGRILDADGSLVGALHLSDGISHTLCAPDGTIWLGYFDEGVFGGARSDTEWPLSCSGIANVSSAGDVLFRANDTAAVQIDDCYALTRADNAIWACVYSGFPIIRLAQNTIRSWTNDVSGASALAVDGDFVLLFGGYGEDKARLALVRLGETSTSLVGAVNLAEFSKDAPMAVQGCEDTVHIVDAHAWRRIRVSEVARYFQERHA